MPPRDADGGAEPNAELVGDGGWRARAATACLAALLLAFIAGQHYRAMPIHNVTEREFIDSDKLVFPDFFIELTEGVATHADWISNPAPYFYTYYPVTGLVVLAFGDDWRPPIAIYAVTMAMAMVVTLAFVIRQASGLAPFTCALVALVATSWLAVLMRYGDAWLGTLGGDSRQLNMITHMLAACALAKIATHPKDTHRLMYAYPVACYLFGVADALFLFQVAMPILAVALAWWLMSPGSAKARAVLAFAAAGFVLVLAGRASLTYVNPFTDNQFGEVWLNVHKDTVQGWIDTFHTHGLVAAISHIENYMVASVNHSIMELFTGANWPTNFLLAGCALVLAPWLARGAIGKRPAKGKAPEAQALVLPMLSQLVLAMFVSLFVMFALVRFIHEYAFPLLWIPYFALAVVWAHLLAKWGGGQSVVGRAMRVAAPALTVLVGCVLAFDLVFFRPNYTVADRIGCQGQVVEGGGLGRGLVPHWHGRQVKVVTDKDVHDLFYLGDIKPSIGMYGHVGNIRHVNGKADYVVTATEKPWVMIRFRQTYGLPAIIKVCASERYMLYEPGHLDSEVIRDVWADIEWRSMLLDPDEPGDIAKRNATYAMR